MAQSLVKIYLHLVFSTKHRKPLIKSDIELELYRYLGGICNNLECPLITVGGDVDHIHILCLLSKKISISKFIGELKSYSSKWIKTKDDKYNDFYWQEGYGAFSVSQSQLEMVSGYIANQKEHHKKSTFQDEFRAILKKYNIEFDEQYVWD